MQDIKSSKTARVDRLSRKLLKYGDDILAKPISVLYNISFSRGVFPSACKVAKLKPIFIKGKKSDSSNGKSISLLPVISKTMVKQMLFVQMKIYCTTTNLTLEQITQQISVYL